MEPKVNYTLVGVFVVVLGAALLAVVIWLSKRDYRGDYDRYYTYMRESVSGLSVDAAVKYHGVEVGRVKEIILNPENSEEVRLTLVIVRETPIKVDTVAVLETQGLTGLTTLNLTGGNRDSPLLTAAPGERYPVIKSGPSLFTRLEDSVARLLADENVPRLLGNLNRLTQDARGIIDERNRAVLRQTLADLAKVTDALAARREDIDTGLVKAGEALESLADLAKQMHEEVPNIMDQARSSIGAFQAMTQDIARSSASLNSALEANRSNVEQFTGQTLADAGLLVSELRELTASLQQLTKRLEEDPSVLMFGRPRQRPGPGE